MNMKCNILILSLFFIGGLSISCAKDSPLKNPYGNKDEDKDDTELKENKDDELQIEFPTLMGNNPIITTRYSADPTARVIGDVLYLYPSSDLDVEKELGGKKFDDINFNAFCMPYYYAYSTKNFFDWKEHGKLYGQEDVPWAIKDKYCMWAPDCIEHNNKYYHYFPTLAIAGGFKVGVAIADKPGGPFKVQPNFIEGTDNIDPNIFIDTDGTPYIIYKGDPYSKIGKLKDSMTEIEGGIKQLKVVKEGEDESKIYTEGPFLFKRKDTYYFTYAYSHNSARSSICYATSDNVFGPYTYKGVILQSGDTWTSHHSVVEYNGEWILFYHNNDISHEDKMRSVCADYLHFEPDGTIKLVEKTKRGIGVVPATRRIEIDRYSTSHKVKIVQSESRFPGNWMLTDVKNGSFVTYDRVDFNKASYEEVHLHYSSITAKGIVTVSNADTGDVLAKFELDATSGDFKTISTDFLSSEKIGEIDLEISFSGDPSVNAKFDWIQFIKD